MAQKAKQMNLRQVNRNRDVPKRQPSWTKRGPGRRHQRLTAAEVLAKNALMAKAGLNASQALDVIAERRRG